MVESQAALLVVLPPPMARPCNGGACLRLQIDRQAIARGNYLADFTSLVNMAVNDAGFVYYYDPKTGDETRVEFIAQ